MLRPPDNPWPTSLSVAQTKRCGVTWGNEDETKRYGGEYPDIGKRVALPQDNRLYRSFHTSREEISAKTRVVHPTSTWVEVSSLDDPKDPAEKGFDLHRLPDRTPAR